ncbi:MAG: hypothetical protein ACREJU_15475 [Nitrospiraceae bacterium]
MSPYGLHQMAGNVAKWDRTCLSHCQFMCTRCLGVVHERGAPPVRAQLDAIAVQAEVEMVSESPFSETVIAVSPVEA